MARWEWAHFIVQVIVVMYMWSLVVHRGEEWCICEGVSGPPATYVDTCTYCHNGPHIIYVN